MRRSLYWLILLFCVARMGAASGEEMPGAAAAGVDSEVLLGWRIVRAMDCARCHGADQNGLAAPSIIAYAKSQTKERFESAVLQGNASRGMPGYMSAAPVVDNIEQIYAYFSGRAAGRVAAGNLELGKPGV